MQLIRYPPIYCQFSILSFLFINFFFFFCSFSVPVLVFVSRAGAQRDRGPEARLEGPPEHRHAPRLLRGAHRVSFLSPPPLLLAPLLTSRSADFAEFVCGTTTMMMQTAHNLYLVFDLCTGGELFDRICAKGNYYEAYALPPPSCSNG